jgi:hypothetical protein
MVVWNEKSTPPPRSGAAGGVPEDARRPSLDGVVEEALASLGLDREAVARMAEDSVALAAEQRR